MRLMIKFNQMIELIQFSDTSKRQNYSFIQFDSKKKINSLIEIVNKSSTLKLSFPMNEIYLIEVLFSPN
jgi:hypothetical protein